MAEEPYDSIHAALQKTGIYVHPSLREQFSQNQLAEIRSNISAHSDPVYVVAWPLRSNDQFNGNTADLLTRLHDAHPEPGVYLATTTRFTTDSVLGIDLEGRQWDVSGPDGNVTPFQLLSTVGYEEHPTLGDAFVRATELLNASPAELEEQYDEAQSTYREEQPQPPGEGPDSGFSLDVTGLVIAVVAIAAVGIAARQFLKNRRGRGAEPAHLLPPSAMARIRAAHDRQLERQAREDVLALGEAIDAAEITETGDAAAWQSALDHYDAARGVMRNEPEVLDVVGAIVLADNGSRALEAAKGGRPFTTPTRCFLNPLHGLAADHRAVKYADHQVRVPLCQQCRQALAQNGNPDILVVERDGRPEHYFETDAEPWASTGFGALEPDLLSRLRV